MSKSTINLKNNCLKFIKLGEPKMAIKLVDDFLEDDFKDPAYNEFIQLSYLYNKKERESLLQLSNDDIGLNKAVFALSKFILALPDHPEKMTNEDKENIKSNIFFIDEIESIYKYNKSFLKKYNAIDKDIIDKFILLNSSPKLSDKLRKDLIEGLEKIKGLDDLIFEVESSAKLLKSTSRTELLIKETELIISKSREEMTLSEVEKFIKIFNDYKKKITSALELQDNGINPFGCIVALSFLAILVASAYRFILYLIKT